MKFLKIIRTHVHLFMSTTLVASLQYTVLKRVLLQTQLLWYFVLEGIIKHFKFKCF